MEVTIVLFVIVMIFITQSVKVVPQQHAWVLERLGKYHGTLTPGLSFLIPFVDKIAYKHSLKEIPLDVPSQVSRIAVMEPGMFGVMEPVSDCRTGLPKGLKDGIILPLLR